MEKIRECFSERTIREIERTKKRMHDMGDKNRNQYLNLTKSFLGLDGEEDSLSESGSDDYGENGI